MNNKYIGLIIGLILLVGALFLTIQLREKVGVPDPVADNTADYLVIQEFGIRLPRLVGMEDLQYRVLSPFPNNTTVTFDSPRLSGLAAQSSDPNAARYCTGPESLYLGTLTRFTGFPDGDDFPMREGTKIVGNQFIGIAGPQDACSTDRMFLEEVSKVIVAIQQSFLKAEDLEGKLLPEVQIGYISGSLSYPSEGIPSDITACAELKDKSKSFCQSSHYLDPEKYTYGEGYYLTVPVGVYNVYATRAQNPRDPDAYRAYYSAAVKCGLTVNCTDHTPLDVRVENGKELTNIDPGDWYAN